MCAKRNRTCWSTALFSKRTYVCMRLKSKSADGCSRAWSERKHFFPGRLLWSLKEWWNLGYIRTRSSSCTITWRAMIKYSKKLSNFLYRWVLSLFLVRSEWAHLKRAKSVAQGHKKMSGNVCRNGEEDSEKTSRDKIRKGIEVHTFHTRQLTLLSINIFFFSCWLKQYALFPWNGFCEIFVFSQHYILFLMNYSVDFGSR